MCRRCRQHEAKFSVRGGAVKADDEHDICFQCYRALKNQQRARGLRNRESG